jgi:hypothetical protein
MGDSNPPEERVEAGPPYLVPRETRGGVRYARPPGVRRKEWPLSPLLSWEVAALVVLSAAIALAVRWLLMYGAAAPGWRLGVALLYPVQLGLDLVAVARLMWVLERGGLGGWEIEVAGGRLQAGRRWGPFWFDRRSVRLAALTRLVIGRRPSGPGEHGSNWDLLAEHADGPPVTLLGADDLGLVLPIARDLHGRLATNPELSRRLPPLAEEDRPALPARPLPRSLLPGGGWGWLAVHVAGSAGLLSTLALAWENPPLPQGFAGLAGLTIALQFLIFLANFAYLQVRRNAPRA